MAAAVATNTVTVLAIATPGRRQAVNLAGTVKPNYRPRHIDGINLKVRSPLVALSCRAGRRQPRQLLGVKRTSQFDRAAAV